MELYSMTEKDLDEISALDKLCFTLPWSRQSFADEIENKIAVYYIMREDGEMIGYCGMWEVSGEGHITNIAVHPNYRRRGYGAVLVDKLIETAVRKNLSLLTLEVRKSNLAARRLYERHGFVILGMRPRYYEDNKEDAYIMTKEMCMEE